jgi:hypothetical protein
MPTCDGIDEFPPCMFFKQRTLTMTNKQAPIFSSFFFLSLHFSQCLYVCFLCIFPFPTLSSCLFSFYLCVTLYNTCTFLFLPVCLSFRIFLSDYYFICFCISVFSLSLTLPFFLSIF